MIILEDHIADRMSTWEFGMGFHGEQGGEYMPHEPFKTSGVVNKVYLTMMKERHL